MLCIVVSRYNVYSFSLSLYILFELNAKYSAKRSILFDLDLAKIMHMLAMKWELELFTFILWLWLWLWVCSGAAVVVSLFFIALTAWYNNSYNDEMLWIFLREMHIITGPQAIATNACGCVESVPERIAIA